MIRSEEKSPFSPVFRHSYWQNFNATYQVSQKISIVNLLSSSTVRFTDRLKKWKTRFRSNFESQSHSTACCSFISDCQFEVNLSIGMEADGIDTRPHGSSHSWKANNFCNITEDVRNDGYSWQSVFSSRAPKIIRYCRDMFWNATWSQFLLPVSVALERSDDSSNLHLAFVFERKPAKLIHK